MILVIGGTGVVGSKVVERLLSMQQPVRVMAAGLSDWRGHITPHFRKAGVEVVTGDLRDHHLVASAVAGCTGIIHTAGIINPSKEHSLESVNVESVASLLSIAQNAGVQRFIFVGCLGSTEFSNAKYLQTKWQAEALVRQSPFFWTIFRPAPIFGDGCQLIRGLEYWVERFPVVLVVGSGLSQMAPVSADDVADCLVQALYNRDTVGQTYDLCGPRTMNFIDVLQAVSNYCLTKSKPVFRIPSGFGYGLAGFLSKMNPRSPVTAEFMKFVTVDAVADPGIMQSHFQVQMTPLESYLKQQPATFAR